MGGGQLCKPSFTTPIAAFGRRRRVVWLLIHTVNSTFAKTAAPRRPDGFQSSQTTILHILFTPDFIRLVTMQDSISIQNNVFSPSGDILFGPAGLAEPSRPGKPGPAGPALAGPVGRHGGYVCAVGPPDNSPWEYTTNENLAYIYIYISMYI